MSKKTSSMQTHGAVANANNSLSAAENAVEQVMSHPSATMHVQAQNAVDKAQRAVAEANRQAMDNPVAAKHATEELASLKDELNDTPPS